MKVGLINIEHKIVNTAYMQISQYHKQKGDTVEWWTPLEHRLFDVVYCSSLFDFTDKSQIPKDVITGGTGFNINSRLSKNMEACDYDYSLYPDCDYSIVWFSRGCIRKCPFCCVHEKEGDIHTYRGPSNWNPNGKYIVVQDNNFFANKDWRYAMDVLLEDPQQPVDFQGVDIRLLTKGRCAYLNSLKHYKQIKIAWDNPKEDLLPNLKKVIEWIPAYKLMCYVLIGYWSTPEEDLYRIEKLRELKIDPFVMAYNKKDPYQKAFARWVNHKAIFKTVKWEDYKATRQDVLDLIKV
jgi:hypothetical protein